MNIKNLKEIIKKTPNILNWSSSIFFLLMGSSTIKTSTIFGLCALAIGFILLPPFIGILKEEFKISPSKNIKTVVLIVLAVLMISTSDSGIKNVEVPITNVQTIENKVENIETNTTQEISTQPVEEKKLYKVTNVVDGDTIDVLIGDKTERIRLIGLDTPETVDPRKEVECFGIEASNKAKETLLNKTISLESDDSQGDKDKYDRLLRYVFLENGTNFNKQMIEDGYGYEYTYNLPYKYQQEFKDAEKQATTNKKGLWADNICKPNPVETAPVVKTNTPTTNQTPTSAPVTNTKNTNTTTTSDYSCSCSKTCAQMSSCAEAQYQLNTCGCSARDGDDDGVACDSQCQ
jgi:micrococcal nuclease